MSAVRASQVHAVPTTPPRVLIIDDSHDTRELYALYFRHKGFTVFTAHDGINGYDTALITRPDVIVMDVSMPELDGIAVTQKLRKDAGTRTTPIVILTGFPLRAIQQGVKEAGADVFLTKPCLPHDLERHVLRLLGREATPPRAA